MKNKLIKGIGILALAAVLAISGGNGLTTTVFAETVSGGNTGEETPGGGEETPGGGGTDTPSVTERLSAPDGLAWDGWKPAWKAVAGAKDYWVVINKGEETVYDYVESKVNAEEILQQIVSWGDGSYTFKVMALKESLDEYSEADSDWSAVSAAKVYAKPTKKLGTTVGWWDKETPGLFRWNSVGDNAVYDIILYYYKADGTKIFAETIQGVSSTQLQLSDYINKYGKFRYYAMIRALSSDITVVLDGDAGEPSEIYDAASNSGSSTGSSTSNSTGSAVVFPDSSVPVNNATATKVKVSSELAAVNAAAGVKNGERLQMEMHGFVGESMKKFVNETIDSAGAKLGYILDITLNVMGSNGAPVRTASELNSPIAITVAAPDNVDGNTYDFAVLRVHEGVATILPDEDNDPATVTFSSDSFSVYAVIYGEKGSFDNIKAAAIKDKVPKTGDALPIVIPSLATVLLAAMAVMFGKKELFRKKN